MKNARAPLDLKKLKVLPLLRRLSRRSLERMLMDPEQPPPFCPSETLATVRECATRIRAARERNSSVILMFGADVVKHGLHSVVNRLVERRLVTHLATDGAGVIHDWELAFLGKTEENVRDNIATGTFGMWDETGRNLHLALLVGATGGQGFGQSVGRFITEDGTTLPAVKTLEQELRNSPSHALAPARAELLRAMVAHKLPEGRVNVAHPHKNTSLLATAFRQGAWFTVHPGIGCDTTATHPMFRGAAIGRSADIDFRLLGGAIENLDGGVILSVGSPNMAAQVFQKALSCVNNLRLQNARPAVEQHSTYVVDLQDGGNWDWQQGEPPKTHPAHNQGFCQNFAHLGGHMKYIQCDNVVFLHNLLALLPA